MRWRWPARRCILRAFESRLSSRTILSLFCHVCSLSAVSLSLSTLLSLRSASSNCISLLLVLCPAGRPLLLSCSIRLTPRTVRSRSVRRTHADPVAHRGRACEQRPPGLLRAPCGSLRGPVAGAPAAAGSAVRSPWSAFTAFSCCATAPFPCLSLPFHCLFLTFHCLQGCCTA